MPTSADLLLDTSAAVALLTADHILHAEVTAVCRNATLGLAGHALFETYSVLTRLPGPNRLRPSMAAHVIRREFPGSVALSTSGTLRAVDALESAGIAGGAVYDGLVALAAREAGMPLLTCDRRAVPTYAALGVRATVI